MLRACPGLAAVEPTQLHHMNCLSSIGAHMFTASLGV